MEKTIYLAHLAGKRVARTEARENLRLCRMVRTAVWGDVEAVEAFEKDAEITAGLKKPDPPEAPQAKRKGALNRIADFVTRRGGKVKRG